MNHMMPSRSHIRSITQRAWLRPLMVVGTLVILTMATGTTHKAEAMDAAQQHVFQNGIADYNLKDCDTGGTDAAGGGAGTTAGATAGSTWQSGAQAPYSLEAFIINVLMDIAKKLNLPEASAVTGEHVGAMVAWAYIEGGNITNHDAFNPWNTGLTSRPDLLAGAGNSSGVQSFKSFDAGVEANAIVMTGNNQNRLGKVLTDGTTTGKQFNHVLNYIAEAPGNKLWSEASQQDVAGYTAKMDANLDKICKAYDQYASVVIGPGEMNAHHVDATQLKFHGCQGAGSGGGGGAASECAGAAEGQAGGNGDIVKTALGLAWPQPTSNSRKDAKPEYIKAVAQYDSGSDYTDCGRFVATVMHMSGVDKDYPDVGTAVQGPYLDKHPEKFQNLGHLSSVTQLQPGDILMNPGTHTELFVGDQGGGVNTAGASLGDHVPNQNGPGELAWLISANFTIYRFKGAPAAVGTAVGGGKTVGLQ